MITILGISGSLRAGSYNTAVIDAAAERAPEDVEVVVFDGLRAVPPYDADEDGDAPPAAVAELREAIDSADALLISTPEYNASIPGVLKNAIDWASRPFPGSALRGTPVAVTGATTGSFGAVWAQAELRKVLATAGARVLDEAVSVGRAQERVDPAGRLTGDDLLAKLDAVVAALAREAELSASLRPAQNAARG